MPRRVSLPGASELFRRTQNGDDPVELEDAAHAPESVDERAREEAAPRPPASRGGRRRLAPSDAVATGRVRHDEKITVYVSTEELMALEEARLLLRREHGIGVDRGRIVRAAIAMAVADLAEQGDAGGLVERLRTP
ncbi:MAG TPA: hypothetical protein VFN73_09015 [Propionibacteriaceae bacterium]|nr:hypothetical protein [Propionibacteriaceae bacterium]